MRKLLAISFVFVGLVVICWLFQPGDGLYAAGGTPTAPAICPVWDTGLIQTTNTAEQTITWTLTTTPNMVSIWVCSSAAATACMYQGHGYYYMAGTGATYGMFVDTLSSTQVTFYYAASVIGYYPSIGNLYRGSAYVRVIAYQLCASSAPTDTPIPTDTPVPTDTLVPTDTPIPTDTPGWYIPTLTPPAAPGATVDPDPFHTVVTQTLSNGNQWAFIRELDAGDIAIGAIALVLLVLSGFKSLARLI
jgi:hypothetical protein